MNSSLTNDLKAAAREWGFTQVGICPAVSTPNFPQFQQWLAEGYAGQMHYLPERADAYAHPESILDGVRSVVMLAMNYQTNDVASTQPGQGRVARYAWGEQDYHDLIHRRLKNLCRWLKERRPDAKARGVVDTAPLLEREFAQMAGLGWVGKNTLLLNRQAGSYFFLAALLTDLELTYDQAHEANHCGTCTACLDACPTDAFVQPYVLDARRCISYLTIELRDEIPLDLREDVGDWLFGCDICQEVCPWNHKAPTTDETAFAPLPEMNPIDAAELFTLDDDAFRQRFRRTPLWRSRRRGILRNAAIVLGNNPSPAGNAALQTGLMDEEPLVREACAWALQRIQAGQQTQQ